jgi:hypothetical protein
MPGFLFTADQVATLIEFSGLAGPASGSPLYPLPPESAPLHPNHPAFTKLVDMHAIEEKGDGWRVNLMVGAALRASLDPHEVISIGIGQQPRPRGFAVVRRDDFLAECTVDGYGNTKLYFPLSRNQLMLLMGDAMTSDSPEPEPTGFRFVGTAEEAFVFAAAMRELREFPVPLAPDRLVEIVRRDAAVPGYVAPFATSAGVAPIEALAGSDRSVDAALQRLIEQGHLVVTDGTIEASPAANEMLGHYPETSFAVSRTVLEDGITRSQRLNVSRVGNRTLVFRLQNPADGPRRFEWAEVNRAQLRALVTAILMTDEQFRLSTTGAGPPPAGPAQEAEGVEAVNFCPYCGTRMSPGFRFCHSCGKELPGA